MTHIDNILDKAEVNGSFVMHAYPRLPIPPDLKYYSIEVMAIINANCFVLFQKDEYPLQSETRPKSTSAKTNFLSDSINRTIFYYQLSYRFCFIFNEFLILFLDRCVSFVSLLQIVVIPLTKISLLAYARSAGSLPFNVTYYFNNGVAPIFID